MRRMKLRSTVQLVTLIINDTEVKVKKGQRLLWAALDNGFYIPNLCAIQQAEPPLASCRLCFVEIEGRGSPVTACTETVNDNMVVRLDTPRVKRLRNTAFELILSHHHIDCGNCSKNGKCELQTIASHLGLKLKLERFRHIPRDLPVDSSHDLFTYDPNKCVMCGKCVWACHTYGTSVLDFVHKGINSVVGTFGGTPLVDTECSSCLACVHVCPTGALIAKQGVSLKETEDLIAWTT